MKKYFSRDIFLEDEILKSGYDANKCCRAWVDICDGVEVINGRCAVEDEFGIMEYHMVDDWCVFKEENESNEEVPIIDVPIINPSEV